MHSEKLEEICRRDVFIQKPFESRLFWNESQQCVLTDKGLCIFTYSMNLNAINKNVDTIATLVFCPKTSPAETVIPDAFMKKQMSNFHFCQFVVNPTLWPHSTNFVQEFATITSCKWSPCDLIHNNGYAIALVNNLGSVNIFKQSRYGWANVLDLSKMVVDQFMSSDTYIKANDFETVKSHCEIVETSAICWQPQLTFMNTCLFVTSQKNGDLLFWKIKSEDYQKLNAQCISNIPSNVGVINNMMWISKDHSEFLLICCAVSGEIYSIICKIENDEIVKTKFTTLWSHKDKMIVRYLEYTKINEQIVILYTKHRHLVVQLIDTCGNVISQYLNNINDYKITTLLQNCGHFYISTINCKIYEIMISVKDSCLVINLTELMFKNSYSNYYLYSFCPSPNNLLWTLNMNYKETRIRKKPRKVDLIYLAVNDTRNELSLLLNNPSRKLTNMYDCVELIRCKAVKNKLIPEIDYDQLYIESQEDIYKLKLYLLFATIYNTVKSITHNPLPKLPETSVEKLKEIILLRHAVNLVTNINQMYESCGEQLTQTQSDVLIGCFHFLNYYCEKYKENVKQYIDPGTKIAVQMINHECMHCGFICKEGHVNSLCSLTFTPINSERYLVCRACGAICRSDLYGDKPMCVFCDLYMDNYFLPS